jgi:hypothetical protein
LKLSVVETFNVSGAVKEIDFLPLPASVNVAETLDTDAASAMPVVYFV